MEPDVPELLNGYQKHNRNRLEMSQWISSAENPLTSRVITNRIFAELFGKGIVETLGDFGSTGVAPSNQATARLPRRHFPNHPQVVPQSLTEGNGLERQLPPGSQHDS